MNIWWVKLLFLAAVWIVAFVGAYQGASWAQRRSKR